MDIYTGNGGPNQDSGIVPGHAYSIIAVKSYKGIRLLEIRNPWGEFEWGGAWSDNSKEWTKEYISVFKPKFDSKDGTFWMSYQDYFKYFNSVNICKVKNWYEARFRGKFIKCWELEDTDEDWVLSKFYYTFKLFDTTNIEFGLHQEDVRILGADRRGYLDLQILILKRHQNGTLTLEHDSGSVTDRELYTSISLTAGHYIIVPRSSGASMRAPDDPLPPVPYKVNFRGKQKIHDYYITTIDDIFRKVDLRLDGQLSAKELNNFGEIIGDDELKTVTTADFFKSKYMNISCDENGVTRFGVKQLFSHYSEQKVTDILTKLGYDESLYSHKSRVFTLSIHSEGKVRVRVSDALKTDLNEKSWDMMMLNYSNKFGKTGAIQNDQCLVFRMHHDKSHSVSYGAINKTSRTIEVILKQKNSVNMLYSPSKGEVRTEVPPHAVVYMASSIIKPGASTYTYKYSFSSKFC